MACSEPYDFNQRSSAGSLYCEQLDEASRDTLISTSALPFRRRAKRIAAATVMGLQFESAGKTSCNSSSSSQSSAAWRDWSAPYSSVTVARKAPNSRSAAFFQAAQS